MTHTRFSPSEGAPAGEVVCIKGYGPVKFGENGRCPLSGALSCSKCDIEENPNSPDGEIV